MIKTISKPFCVYCKKRFSTDSNVYENSNGFIYCSVECIIKSRGFNIIKWSDKYIEIAEVSANDTSTKEIS